MNRRWGKLLAGYDRGLAQAKAEFTGSGTT